MTNKFFNLSVIILCALCLAVASVSARTMVTVDSMAIPEVDYGVQKANVSVTNGTNALHFVTIIAETQFTGPGLTPNRNTRNHFYLEPGASLAVEPVLIVPANYGSAEISLRVYDVVDTLDALIDRYLVEERSFQVEFPAPASVAPYRETEINLPPRVEDHPYFDNDLSRLMLIMMNQGIMVDEIAEITGFRLTMAQEMFGRLLAKGHLTSNSRQDSVVLAFPVISYEEAQKSSELAFALADSLTERIKNNLDDYQRVIDSLVAADAMSEDPNLIMHKGAALYHLYPTISSLLLWYDLGREFIVRKAHLIIYDGTDLCNALIPTYMYVVQAGPELNGDHFYAESVSQRSYSITYGDHPPHVLCPDDFILRAQRNMKINWQFDVESRQKRYLFDSTVVEPALNALSGGAENLLSATYYDLRDISTEFGHTRLGYGQRYWFWNLVATRTLDQLVEQGVIEQEGNGNYRFEGYQL